MTVLCDYCGQPAELVRGNAIYPDRPDLWALHYWRCTPCGAYVGCHKAGATGRGDGTQPLGRLADAELRRAKMRAHAAFDPAWRSGRLSRSRAYARLATALGIPRSRCHIGYFDVAECERVVAAVYAHPELFS